VTIISTASTPTEAGSTVELVPPSQQRPTFDRYKWEPAAKELFREVRRVEQDSLESAMAYWNELSKGQEYPRWTLITSQQRCLLWRLQLITGENAVEQLCRLRFDSEQNLVGRLQCNKLQRITLEGKIIDL
jgi:hypothetical protein